MRRPIDGIASLACGRAFVETMMKTTMTSAIRTSSIAFWFGQADVTAPADVSGTSAGAAK
jgi:hypothetical protein